MAAAAALAGPELQAAFDAAAASVKTFALTKTVPDAEKLKVYGLFKQSTVGDCTTARCVPSRAHMAARRGAAAPLPSVVCRSLLRGAVCVTGPACFIRLTRRSGTGGTLRRVRGAAARTRLHTRRRAACAGKAKEVAQTEYIAEVKRQQTEYA